MPHCIAPQLVRTHCRPSQYIVVTFSLSIPLNSFLCGFSRNMAGACNGRMEESQRLLRVVMSERLTDGQIVRFNNVDVVYSLRGGVPGHVLPGRLSLSLVTTHRQAIHESGNDGITAIKCVMSQCLKCLKCLYFVASTLALNLISNRLIISPTAPSPSTATATPPPTPPEAVIGFLSGRSKSS